MCRIVLALTHDARIEGPPGSRCIAGPGWVLPFDDLPTAVTNALPRLEQDGGATEADLAGAVIDQDGAALPVLYSVLHQLEDHGALSRKLLEDDRLIAIWIPASGHPLVTVGDSSSPSALVLSRFAYIRRSHGGLLLESPIGRGRLQLIDPAALNLIGALHEPLRPDSLRDTSGLSAGATAVVVDWLQHGGLLSRVSGDGRHEEDEDPDLRAWGFADRLFHAAVAWTPAVLPRVPAISPGVAGSSVALPCAGTGRALAEPAEYLADVMNRRRSIRLHDDGNPLDVAELGSFLDMVARAKPALPGQRARLRTYPSGGARYPLEFYIIVRTTGGLEPGVYRYDPYAHRLEDLAAPPSLCESMLNDAMAAMDGTRPPQLVIVNAADVERTTRKYETAGYSLMLKEAGVVCEAMYLVATALQLAGCALGSVNGPLFEALLAARARPGEVTVGGFALGRPAEG